MNLCAKIQAAADTGNVKDMFDGIKKAIGPTQEKCAPLKTSTGEIITEKSKLMECWVEHYSELYGSASSISPSTLNKIERLPTFYELDAIPTTEELSEAIREISSGKAPGLDGIPAEIFKCGGSKLLLDTLNASASLQVLGVGIRPSGYERTPPLITCTRTRETVVIVITTVVSHCYALPANYLLG